MFEYIYPLLLIIGFTTLAVVYIYNFLLKKVLHVMIKLFSIDVDFKEHLDVYIDEISLYLREIGILDITYTLHYSQKQIRTPKRKTEAVLIKQIIKDDLISGEILLHVRTDRGERKIINRLVLHIVTTQIIRFIHYKIRTLNESFEQMAKLQTYMLHDMKNILQFFQAMQYNVENLQDSDERDRFIDFLQNSTQPISYKVNKILALLKVKSHSHAIYTEKRSSIASIFHEYVKVYNLKCTIQGDILTNISKEHIRTIADNLLSNIADKMYQERELTCKVIISPSDRYINIIIKDSGSEFIKLSQISEPFYTTKEQGIGIGLYQVKSIVNQLNGTITFKNQNTHPYINIKLPKM